MKILLTVINIVSAIPLLLYPYAFLAGVMSFDAPGSGQSPQTWITFTVLVSYPLLIAVLIFLSRKYASSVIASIALVPLLALIYVLFVSGGTDQKLNYNTLSRDFSCDSNSFLHIDGVDHPISDISLLEKKNFLTYARYHIATIYKEKWIKPEIINIKDISKRTPTLLAGCKNKDGKSPFEVYARVSDAQAKDIIKMIYSHSGEREQ